MKPWQVTSIVVLTMLASLQLIPAQTVPCSETHLVLFHCADDTTCIERKSFCDNATDCPDVSDETPYSAANANQGLECDSIYTETSTKCLLPTRYKCDHEIDCVNGLDECDCSHTFTCEGVGCVLKVSFCDGNIDCSDGTDEWKFNRTTKVGFQCPVTRTHVTNNCILPDRYLCDGDSDCDNGIDECFCDFTPGVKKGAYLKDSYSNDKCFRCLDGSLVIPNIYVCDGIVHCEDLSDECLCSQKGNKPVPDLCNSVCVGTDCECKGKLSCVPKASSTTAPSAEQGNVCIDSTSICDNVFDCENHVDEKYCADLNQTFECYDKKKKIPKHEFCNGNIRNECCYSNVVHIEGPSDCEDESDELYCAQLTDHYCQYYRGTFQHVTDWNNVTEADGVGFPPNLKLHFDYPFYTNQCDGIPMCGELDDECFANCSGGDPGFCKYVSAPGQPFRCPVSGSLIIGKEICDGKPTCNDTAPEISEDELYCPNRFYCSDRGAIRLPIHIPTSSRCDQIQECADQSDEMNCADSTHFYCKDGGARLFVPRTQVCDGTKDCRGGKDECDNCNPSPFSSDEKLISSRVLVVFLWIIGLVAVIGNILVFIHQAKNLIRPQGTQSKVGRCNRILVLNLSMSDTLVGIYLVALGIKDATVNEYCLLDQEWRTSSTCSALGSMALIGTETSVFILTIMTAYRLYLVVKPFKTQKTFVVKVGVVVAWFFSLLLAFVPFTKSAADYFVSCVWFRNNQFFGLICRPDLIAFTADLVTHEGKNISFSTALGGGYTWDNMFAAVKLFNSSYVPERFFGYYSAHSVCLPRLFPDPIQDVSWGYSLFLILLNFCAFLFILISYLVIYRLTTRKTVATTASAEGRAATLQRKITRIVLTDFCCWMPICIMAFIKVSGVYVPEDAYAVTAIILLPINAAMNPFLYSDILDIIWEKMLPVREWFNSTVCGQKLEERRKKRARLSETHSPTRITNTNSSQPISTNDQLSDGKVQNTKV